jgi:hypothetical protein
MDTTKEEGAPSHGTPSKTPRNDSNSAAQKIDGLAFGTRTN